MILDRIIEWLFPWRWLGVAVLVFWGFTMSSMFSQGKTDKQQKDIEELFPWAVQRKPQEGDEWMGIYLKGRKIGYTHAVTKAKGKGFVIENRSRMWMKLFNTNQKIATLSQVEVDERYRLKKFLFRMKSSLSTFLAKGYVWRDRLFVTMHIGSNKRSYRIPYKPALLASAIRPYIASQKPPPGRKIRTLLFDPQSLSYQKSVIEVEGYEMMKFNGKSIKALRIKQNYKGTILRAWLDQNGKVLKEKASSGMILLRETVEKATRGLKKDMDIIRATRVSFQGRIPNPKTRPELKLYLRGVRLTGFPDLGRGRQSLRKQGFLTIQREKPLSMQPLPFSSAVSPLSKKEWKKQPKSIRKALKSTHLVQARHPKIHAKAQELTRKASDRLQAITAIHQWLLRRIRKKSVVGIPSALETLNKRVGDCNEHATLLAALARSVRIPCHIISGLAFLRGQFYFHAWNECQVGKGQWLTVDSTWGQLPADVTHIAFIRGGLNQQMGLMQLMGKLKIHIVEDKSLQKKR